MLKIHTNDGQTIRVDLSDPEQAREWLPRLERDGFQATISGVSVVETHAVSAKCPACGGKATGQVGVQYSLSRPQAFSSVRYDMEAISGDGDKLKGADRVTMFADGVKVQLMAHHSQPSARMLLVKSGKRRFAPRHVTNVG